MTDGSSWIILPTLFGCHTVLQGIALLSKKKPKLREPQALVLQCFEELDLPIVWANWRLTSILGLGCWAASLGGGSCTALPTIGGNRVSWALGTLVLVSSAVINWLFPNSLPHVKWTVAAPMNALIALLAWRWAIGTVEWLVDLLVRLIRMRRKDEDGMPDRWVFALLAGEGEGLYMEEVAPSWPSDGHMHQFKGTIFVRDYIPRSVWSIAPTVVSEQSRSKVYFLRHVHRRSILISPSLRVGECLMTKLGLTGLALPMIARLLLVPVLYSIVLFATVKSSFWAGAVTSTVALLAVALAYARLWSSTTAMRVVADAMPSFIQRAISLIMWQSWTASNYSVSEHLSLRAIQEAYEWYDAIIRTTGSAELESGSTVSLVRHLSEISPRLHGVLARLGKQLFRGVRGYIWSMMLKRRPANTSRRLEQGARGSHPSPLASGAPGSQALRWILSNAVLRIFSMIASINGQFVSSGHATQIIKILFGTMRQRALEEGFGFRLFRTKIERIRERSWWSSLESAAGGSLSISEVEKFFLTAMQISLDSVHQKCEEILEGACVTTVLDRLELSVWKAVIELNERAFARKGKNVTIELWDGGPNTFGRRDFGECTEAMIYGWSKTMIFQAVRFPNPPVLGRSGGFIPQETSGFITGSPLPWREFIDLGASRPDHIIKTSAVYRLGALCSEDKGDRRTEVSGLIFPGQMRVMNSAVERDLLRGCGWPVRDEGTWQREYIGNASTGNRVSICLALESVGEGMMMEMALSGMDIYPSSSE